LEACPRAASALGIADLWIKRDDLTGLAFGGNKARKLAFELPAAVDAGADTLIAGGGVSQSNHARQVAAVAAKLGMRCILVLRSGPKGAFQQGNLFLDQILGAEVRLMDTDDAEEVLAEMDSIAIRLKNEGRHPFVVELEAPSVAAYAGCALEIRDQLQAIGAVATHVFLASDGGTQAGLLLGNALLGTGWRVVAARPHPTDEDPTEIAADQFRKGAELLGADLVLDRSDIVNLQQYIGPGYGRTTPESREAIRFLARTEGILLDPVYTSKAFAALMDWARRGDLNADSRVVFLHTGGTPALFAYADDLAATVRESSTP
jgi:1-aminocyclopropane-1-carboxylate deaminase/D-cysteine desulfhydrase-like pyridoxal-dependent ACC family enzyme